MHGDVLSVVEFIRFQIPAVPHEITTKTVQKIIAGESLEDVDLDDLAYCYGLYTQANKILGRQSVAAEAFEKARKLVQTRFENVLNSYPLACTYFCLCLYCISDDNIDKATFYTGVMNIFLNKNNVNGEYEGLKKLHEMVTGVMKNNFDIGDIMKRFVWQFMTLRALYKPEASTASRQTDDEIDKLLRSEEPMSEVGIHHLEEALLSLCDKLASQMDPTAIQIRRLCTLFLSNGAILQLHQRENRFDDVTRRAADFISSLTQTPYFNLSPPIACMSLVLASTVHLQCLQMCTNQDEKDVVIARLREDLWGMQCVASWFKIFRNKFQFMIDRVNEALSLQNASEITRSIPEFNYDFANTLQNFVVQMRDQQEPQKRELDSLEEFEFEVVEDPFVENLMSTVDYDMFFDNFQF